MPHPSGTREVPIDPHTVTAAEVVPGDLVALAHEDAARRRWHVVTHTLPESPEVIRVTLRPPLGGTDREEVLRREQRVTVAGRRVDAAAVPPVAPPPPDGVGLRRGTG
ncbi:hypothetical protein GCM10019016_064810 [Streptomyces prasinosporus]|uniref:Uncharacterized protein n=1 Tax=Streptomyces prasinosporus TaxID=68256 RepID=A0ABP6TY41_9ACTN